MVGNSKITVKIGGVERVLKFGLGATRIVCQHHGLKLDELAAKIGVDALFQDEIYGGLVHVLALAGKKPDFTYSEVLDWIDEMPQNDFQELFDKWLMTNQHGKTRYEKLIEAMIATNPTAATDEKKN